MACFECTASKLVNHNGGVDKKSIIQYHTVVIFINNHRIKNMNPEAYIGIGGFAAGVVLTVVAVYLIFGPRTEERGGLPLL